ncbi:hypothetical protein [Mycobacterium servetii]|uniref:Lipoprotein n=1 Tax=Mycobacterium servetii TaxID=3237418 RepID=A0ABV4C691_9MYCO
MTTHGNVTKRTVRRAAAVLITAFAALAAGCGASASIPPVRNPGGGGIVQGG